MRLWPAAAALCLLACGEFGSGRDQADPPEPIGRKLYRGSLGERARVLFFEASDTALSLAYDTVHCGLAAAWKGPVAGPLRDADGAYAPQGPVYQDRVPARLWTVRNGKDTLAPAVRWLGHTEDSTGYVAFRYALILPSGDSIKVIEEPSWDNHYGDNSLQRDFEMMGIPPGDTVSVVLGGAPGRWKETWSHSADGAMIGTGQDRRLEMALGGVANVKVLWEGSASP